jgi:hypothetical protein
MTTAELLRAAKAKLADETCWTKGALARNADGLPVDPDDPTAVCWCSDGAIQAVTTYHRSFRANLRVRVERACGGVWVEDFNDAPDTTFADVHRAFDTAIEVAEQRPV